MLLMLHTYDSPFFVFTFTGVSNSYSGSVSDINELNLPKTCEINFPDDDDLLNFRLIISPDEVCLFTSHPGNTVFLLSATEPRTRITNNILLFKLLFIQCRFADRHRPQY